MESSTAVENRHVSVGRFALDIPATWRWENQGFTVRSSEIQEERWKGKGKPIPEQADRLWQQRLDEIRKIDYGWPSHVDTVILEERRLTTRLRGVLFHGAYLHTYLRWLLLLETEEGAVWFEKEFPSEQAEEALEELQYLANQHRSGEPSATSDANHFALREGYLVLAATGQEKMFARFASSEGITFTMKSRTTSNPKEPEGFWNPGSFLERGARMLGFRSEVVRAGEREVAGMKGKEEVLRLDEEEQEALRGFWLYPGQKGTATNPRMEIEITTSDTSDEEALLTIWDAVLNSVVLLGTNP